MKAAGRIKLVGVVRLRKQNSNCKISTIFNPISNKYFLKGEGDYSTMIKKAIIASYPRRKGIKEIGRLPPLNSTWRHDNTSDI